MNKETEEREREEQTAATKRERETTGTKKERERQLGQEHFKARWTRKEERKRDC